MKIPPVVPAWIVACLLFGSCQLAFASKVVVTGDSIALNLAVYLPGSLAAAGHSGWTVEQVSVGGTTSARYAGLEPGFDPFAPQAVALNPDVVVWMIGTNDGFQNIPLATYASNVADSLDVYQASGTRVVVLSVIPIIQPGKETGNALIDQYNQHMQAEAAAHGLEFYDVSAHLQAAPNWQAYYSADGVHLGGTANSQLGWQWLANDVAIVVVPEPSAWLLALLGMMIVILAFRQSRPASCR